MKIFSKKIIMFLFFIVIILLLSNNLSLFNNNKSLSTINKKFEDTVVFYPQHQDDEVLWAGSAIRSAIDQVGRDNVYVVLISQGLGVKVLKENKYKNLSEREKAELRNYEFKRAVNELGVKKENIILLFEHGNKYGYNFEGMENIALEFEKNFKNVTHIAHSYKFDDHPLHIKNGEVIQNLYQSKKIKSCMYFFKPRFKNKITNKETTLYTVNNIYDYVKIRSACLQYNYSKIYNTEGIGYKSAKNYFLALFTDLNLTSYLHSPEI